MTTAFYALSLILVGLTAAGLGATQFIAAKAVSAHPPSGIFVPVEGGRMHVRDMGPRDALPEKTLVLIHGASSNLHALTVPLQPLMEAGYRIIALDRPGHGHSDRPGGRADASPARQAKLISEAMLAVGAERALVVGHSFGGAVATTLAMDFPERVVGLLLLGPATHPWPGGIAWYYHPASHPVWGWPFTHVIAAPGASLFMEAGLQSVFEPQIKPLDYEEKTALRLLLRPANFRANAEDVAGLLAHVMARAGRYSTIKAPTTVISGDRDTTVSTTLHTMILAKELPEARIIILPGVGHMPHHADPQRILNEIEALSVRAAVPRP